MSRGVRASFLLCVALSVSACSYLESRWTDATEIVWLDAGLGKAVGVDVQATELIHQGIGFYRGVGKVGYCFGTVRKWTEEGVVSPPIPLPILYWGPAYRYGWGFRDVRELENNAVVRSGVTILSGVDACRDARTYNWLHFADVDVGLYSGISLRLGLSPGEVVDFLVGWFGWSLSDDPPPRPVSPFSEPDPSRKAAVSLRQSAP